VTDDTGREGSSPNAGRARQGAGEKILLALMLVIVGAALGYAGYRASVGGAAPDLAEGDVLLVSKGEPVDLVVHAVEGKYTIYDFYADWCPPCRSLDVQLRELAATHDNVAIRKIDIIDWTTPVVDQHGVTGLPYMVIYGPDRERLAEGDDVYMVVENLFDRTLE
jgi:thiol-disulfide isomerase/thioredoxin